jgi:pimeloyl-ACP methyl ester carboxylesterase
VGWIFALAALVSVGVGVWLTSILVEALRQAPPAPRSLRWAPDIPILYLELDGVRLRYIKTGQGPVIVLLHTVRTQLDLFEKVIPELAKSFTVYAIDYPGHGFSDIPDARYDAELFVDAVSRALDALTLRGATLCGVSIGACVALILAGRGDPRVDRVVAINPYDYARGHGLARGSFVGWLTDAAAHIPVVGETFMRLRSFPITKAAFAGGVVDPSSFPAPLLEEMHRVGNRRGHYRAFISLLRHTETFEKATDVYRMITIPVRLVWGDHDWSKVAEREHDAQLIPGVQVKVVARGGHFLPIDRPDAVIDELKNFVPHA